MSKTNTKKRRSRRMFLRRAAVAGLGAATAPLVVPSSALGLAGSTAPSNRVAVGCIGLGSRGGYLAQSLAGNSQAQLAAVCDVRSETREAARAKAGLPPKAALADFREVIDHHDIDAVTIATCDHWHVLISIAAAKAGKDVFCEKPLSNTVAEGRALVDAIRRHGTVFQHGTVFRSGRSKLACELVRNGRLGRLQAVLVGGRGGRGGSSLPKAEPVPDGLDYDLWLGPAPDAPYTTGRVNGGGWYFISDYCKSGWVASYGIHDMDVAVWGLEPEWLSRPFTIEGQAVYPEDGLYDTPMTWQLEYTFADNVKLLYATSDKIMQGVRFQGTEGWVFCTRGWGLHPRSLEKEKFQADEVHLHGCRGSLIGEFLDCVKTRELTSNNVDVAHQSTTVCLIGGIALKLGRRLTWNPAEERFIDDPEADRLLSYAMRPPWHL